MQLPFFGELYAHMEWADAFVWQSVLPDEAVHDDDFIIDSLVHLHMVQRAYLAAWTNAEVTTPSRQDFDDLIDIRDWAQSYHRDVAQFLGQLGEPQLAEAIPIPWTEFIEKEIGGPITPARLGDMVYQVPAHSVHHRAQINHRIREVGGSPGMVDYIGWVWRGRPAAEWPS